MGISPGIIALVVLLTACCAFNELAVWLLRKAFKGVRRVLFARKNRPE